MENFYEGLQRHLYKCELEYRAKMLPKGSKVEWLAPYCKNVKDLAEFLRWCGFRIKEIVDDDDPLGGRMQWVVTTSGVIVYVNDRPEWEKYGLVAASASRWSW